MGIPHKHAAIIKAWADGAKIQGKGYRSENWINLKSPSWSLDWEYRIKPKPPVKKYRYAYELYMGSTHVSVNHFKDDEAFLASYGQELKWFGRIDVTVKEFPDT